MNTVNLNEKKFWQSSNFWTAIVLAVGGLFQGFVPDVGVEFVAGIFGVLASGKMLHNFFKREAVFDKTQLWSANFWNYVAVITTSISPIILPDELFLYLKDLVESLANGNWQGVLTAVFSLATVLYHLIKNNKSEAKDEIANKLGATT